MEKQTLQAEVRTESGKGPARRLRANGKLPAVFYGPKQQPIALAVSPKELTKALRTPFRRNVLIDLQFEGKSETAIVKDLAIDPVTRLPLHVDLYRVAEGQRLKVNVPFETEGRAIGVQKGGVLKRVFRTIPLESDPEKVPAVIKVDVSDLDMDQAITVSQLDLGEGVIVLLDPSQNLALVETEKRRVSDEDETKSAEAVAEGAATAEKKEEAK